MCKDEGPEDGLESQYSCVSHVMRLPLFKSLIPGSAGQCVSAEPKEIMLNSCWMVTVLPMWLHRHLKNKYLPESSFSLGLDI